LFELKKKRKKKEVNELAKTYLENDFLFFFSFREGKSKKKT